MRSLLQVVCISVFLLFRSILNFVSIMRFSLNKQLYLNLFYH